MAGGACRRANEKVIACCRTREREIAKEGEERDRSRERGWGGGEQRAISGHGPPVAMAMTSG